MPATHFVADRAITGPSRRSSFWNLAAIIPAPLLTIRKIKLQIARPFPVHLSALSG